MSESYEGSGRRQIIPRPPDWQAGPGAAWPTDRLPTLAALAAAATPGEADHRPAADARASAVLVVLTDVGRGPEVLLTRRSWEMRTHKGEVSFPGGRIDPGESALEAALREADEEVGLDPDAVTVHGELAHINTYVSKSYIVPKVATVTGRPALQARTVEVDRVMWVPIAEFVRAGRYHTEVWGPAPRDPTIERVLHFFTLDDEIVWGATARILVDLLTRRHTSRRASSGER